MYTINQYGITDKLEEYGFNFLTSEADSTGLRILVDLNESAAAILSEFMGGCEFTNENYNSDSVFSCFLPRSMEFNTSLLVFCLFRENNENVIVECFPKPGYGRDINTQIRVFTSDEWYNPNEKTEELINRIRELYNIRVHSLGNAPRRGLSNVHAFTGRSQ